ncbi:MAG: hypothetical protein V2I33_24465 [Kangiellaceae bacterium]|nr:hypothetical protein [Kangiellaceae bacterium]
MFNPERIMRNTLQKILRAAGVNVDRAWIRWRMLHLQQDRAAAKLARRNVAAANMGEILDKKRRKQLKSGLKPLADGVAHTKMQTKIINRLHYIAFGQLKNAFRDWTECISKYRNALNKKREEYINKMALSCMSKHQQAFMIWKDLMQKKRSEEALMRQMIDKMLRSAGLMVYNLFTRWKLDTFTDMQKRREMRKNRKLMAMGDCLDKKHRQHLKAGYNAIATDTMNTKMRTRIVNRLNFVYFGRMQQGFDNWKYMIFAKLREEMERKKARVIDDFIRSSMSPLQKTFLKWAKFMRDENKREYGE